MFRHLKLEIACVSNYGFKWLKNYNNLFSKCYPWCSWNACFYFSSFEAGIADAISSFKWRKIFLSMKHTHLQKMNDFINWARSKHYSINFCAILFGLILHWNRIFMVPASQGLLYVLLFLTSLTFVLLITTIVVFNSIHCYWERKEWLNIKICKCLVSNKTNVGNFQPLEVVYRGSETQLQVGENLNKLT